MNQPEEIMKQAFMKLKETTQLFKQAELAYKERDEDKTADKENMVNVHSSIQYLAKAYDEVSAIWENDINV